MVEEEDLVANVAGRKKPLTAAGLLGDMYYKHMSLDPQNVSLASSFICMLHIANEEGLRFEQAETFTDDALQQKLAESDFAIKRVNENELAPSKNNRAR